MAGHAMPGETVLKLETLREAETPGAVVASLVAEHARMVFRIAYSILRNHHDAEDAAQECFLKVLKAATKSQTRLELVRSPKTWLARVAWTTALDRRSRRAIIGGHEVAAEILAPGFQEEDHAGHALLEQVPDGMTPPDLQLVQRQMREQLEKVIATLPENLRQPLELSTVQELNSAEIADVMGIPEGSVRTRLLRARRLLKEKLAGLMEVKKHG